MGVSALGVGGHRLAERRFCLLLAPAGRLDGSERRVGRRRCRIELHGLLDLLQRRGEIVQARERAAKQDQGVHVLRILLQHPRGAHARILELLRGQQERGGLELHVVVVGQQIRRTDVLAVAALRIARLQVRLGELQTRFAGAGILLQRIPVLHDGLAKFLPGDEAVAALQELAPGTCRILRARSDPCAQHHQHDQEPSACSRCPH